MGQAKIVYESKKKPGPALKYGESTAIVPARLPESVRDQLTEAAERKGIGRSEAIVLAVKAWLRRIR